LKLSNVKEAAF